MEQSSHTAIGEDLHTSTGVHTPIGEDSQTPIEEATYSVKQGSPPWREWEAYCKTLTLKHTITHSIAHFNTHTNTQLHIYR